MLVCVTGPMKSTSPAPGMWTKGTSSVVSALRAGIIAIFCALAILLAVMPAHAADDAAGGPMAAIEAVFSEGVDEEPPAWPDTLPGHGSGPFCGHVALLRSSAVATCPPADEASSRSSFAPAHALVPGPSELLTKPPRA
ncbi:hypothetical protein [Roseomonas sp. KE0001]|uniref:hypothetical protein n=1 Tax=Roseomonas sp. KE0001 TaxID=2479201 RepID=UPI0018DF5932|nr:hypothetical protein [Roseomonas sp. KE0001]